MTPEDREKYGRSIGKPSMGWTSTKAREHAIRQSEKDLQKQIAGYLQMKGVQFINPPMHRRSSLPEGWPDFTFAAEGKPCAVECKVWNEKPRQEQDRRLQQLAENGWIVSVCRSLQEFIEFFREIKSTPHGAPAPADQEEAGN
jgi:hypothetical protein